MNSEQLLAKLKQYPLAVGCVLVIIVMLVLSFLRGDRISALQAEADQLQAQDEVIDANAKNAHELPKNLETLQEIAENIDSRVIDPEANTDNYRYFLGMAEAANVQLVDPSTGKVSQPKDMKVYPLVNIPLQVTGEFKNVLKFVYLLRTGNYIIRIDRMLLTPREGGGNVYRVSLNLETTGIAKPEEKKK